MTAKPFYRIHVYGEPDRYVHRFLAFEEAQQTLDAIGRRGCVDSYDEHGKMVAQRGSWIGGPTRVAE